MRKIKAAAFDMDGLMFDTERINHKTVSILLGRRGYRYTDELRRDVMGRPARYNAEKFVETFHLSETWEEIAAESQDIFVELLKEGCPAMPGLFGLLAVLESLSIPKCVATSASRYLTGLILAHGNLKSEFQFLITADDITRGKPDPQIYQLAAERFEILPENLLVFEDSRAGIRSAKEAGGICFALRAEHNRDQDLSEADLITERLDDPRIVHFLRNGVSLNG